MAATVSPQPLAAGEPSQNVTEHISNPNPQVYYDTSLNPKPIESSFSKTNIKPIAVIHGIPTLQFTTDERQELAKEEGLHQAIVAKISPGAPYLPTMRTLLLKVFGIKGRCLIGLLAPRKLLIRVNHYDDFVNALIRKQPDGVQSIMTEKKVENLHNTKNTNEVLDNKLEEDGQRAKEMEVTVDVDSGRVVNDVGVSMKSKKLRKGKDKVGDDDWTVVTHQKGMGTIVDTLVRDNESVKFLKGNY
ncbi:hypothetical protein K7X08_020175 [Anisodus acutangulus]|uniref:Uncharacterized protein n=1 Tax=Anisodus acutangulus TaxID=402998 RepID=A0A9Q1M9N3_9SOLA|nr:hypothetical protein K7X08_020175 [Anisodus acutangulus]